MIPMKTLKMNEDIFEIKDGKARESLNFDKSATQGYILTATNSGNGTQWSPVGLPTDAQTAAAVSDWLDEHPEASTTVQDGSITEAKISSNFLPSIKNDYVTPEMFGAVGDGIADDTASIQNCLDSGKYVLCLSSEYKITEPLRMKADTTIDLNWSTWRCTDTHVLFNFEGDDTFTAYAGNGHIEIKNGTIYGGCVSLIHGERIVIENIDFYNALTNHFIELCACRDVSVRNCKFSGMTYFSGSAMEPLNLDPCNRTAFPHFDEDNDIPYDGTPNKNILITDNVFEKGTGEFENMSHGVGVHWANVAFNLHDDVRIINNVINSASEIGISIAGCTNSRVEGNRIITNKRAVRVGFGDSNVVANNLFIVTTNNAPIEFYQPTTNITIDGNSNESTLNGEQNGRYLLGGSNINGSSFLRLQRTQILISDSLTQQLPYKFTLFTDMYLMCGYNGNGTYSEEHIASYYGRTFEVGTARRYHTQNADGTFTAHVLTFDSEDDTKVTFDELPRYVEAETRFTRSH